MPDNLLADIQARTEKYWDDLTSDYQEATRISVHDFHYGPLLPGDKELQLLNRPLEGLRCLELGCGAGQNSIFLAKHGATCTAIDVAEKQLEHGRQLADVENTNVEYRQGDLDSLSEPSQWDLVHSTYALPFSTNPVDAIARMAAAVRPGGQLLLTTGHPLFAGEWLEVEEEGEGMFIRDYFCPPLDPRFTESGDLAGARQMPVSAILQAVIDAGLTVSRVLEPEPIPLPDLTEPTLVPYYSEAWAELYPQIAKVPVVLTVQARKQD